MRADVDLWTHGETPPDETERIRDREAAPRGGHGQQHHRDLKVFLLPALLML